MRTHHALPLLLLIPACGDDIRPADLSRATPAQLTAAVGAASGRDAIGNADRISSMTKGDGSGCPSVELRADGSVLITGGCGAYTGWAVIEPSTTSLQITAEDFGDATATLSGSIDLAIDQTRLTADLETHADVSLYTHLEVTCAPGGLCEPDGSWLELDDLGHVDVMGAWRPEPAGGFLTLFGLQTLTLDFNAGGTCVPYTIDGIAAGCL